MQHFCLAGSGGRIVRRFPTWLPELIRLEDFGGDWQAYISAVYEAFKRDFVYSQTQFQGVPVRLRHGPFYDKKESTFWHVVSSEAAGTVERIPDLRRCERVKWIKPAIEKVNSPEVKHFIETRGQRIDHLLWLDCEDEDCKGYLVVLQQRKKACVLVTAYCVQYRHKQQQLQQSYERFLKKQTPPT